MTQPVDIEKNERLLLVMQMKCLYRHLKGVDLHPGQIQFLRMLVVSGKCKQRDIAEKMNVSSASVGVSVRRLLNIGLVKKTAVENDLRATNIELTEKGKEIAKQAEQSGKELIAAKYNGVTQQQLETYYEIQSRITQNVKQYLNEETADRFG